MSEDQFALPTFLPRSAITGIRNINDFPDGLLELSDFLNVVYNCLVKNKIPVKKFIVCLLTCPSFGSTMESISACQQTIQVRLYRF